MSLLASGTAHAQHFSPPRRALSLTRGLALRWIRPLVKLGTLTLENNLLAQLCALGRSLAHLTLGEQGQMCTAFYLVTGIANEVTIHLTFEGFHSCFLLSNVSLRSHKTDQDTLAGPKGE